MRGGRKSTGVLAGAALGTPFLLRKDGCMKKENKYLLFALPSFILIFSIMLFPVGYAVVYSFTNYRLGREAKFIGLDNYINVLHPLLYHRGSNGGYF